MTRVEANKAIARQVIEEIWNRRNQDAIDMLYAADYMARDIAPSINPGGDGYKQWVSDALRTFPDAIITLEEMVQGRTAISGSPLWAGGAAGHEPRRQAGRHRHAHLRGPDQGELGSYQNRAPFAADPPHPLTAGMHPRWKCGTN
jgi:hypothetical protein